MNELNELSTVNELTNPENKWLSIHPSLGLSMMDHLFAKLDSMYPNRWNSAYPNEISINNWRSTWSEAFEQKGITPRHIRAGLDECLVLYNWPPSLPEFLKACLVTTPAIHQSFSKLPEQRMTDAERRHNLAKFKEFTSKLFNKDQC